MASSEELEVLKEVTGRLDRANIGYMVTAFHGDKLLLSSAHDPGHRYRRRAGGRRPQQVYLPSLRATIIWTRKR